MKFIREHNKVYAKDEKGELLAEVVFPNVTNGMVSIDRTFVSPVLRGGGVAGQLLDIAYDEIKRQGKKARAKCSYAVSWFQKNEDKRDILVD